MIGNLQTSLNNFLPQKRKMHGIKFATRNRIPPPHRLIITDIIFYICVERNISSEHQPASDYGF